MPSKPKKPCRWPGCPALTLDPYCPDHTKVSGIMDRGERGSSSRRGYGRRHQKLRENLLSREPLCQVCQQEPATIRDHVIPIAAGGALYALDNEQALCMTCHNQKTAREKAEGIV